MVEVPNKNYYLAETEVTNHTYSLVMGTKKDDLEPVSNITWQDAIIFCNKLSQLMGLKPVYTYKGKTDLYMVLPGDTKDIVEDSSADGFRLPTEREWNTAASDGKFSSHLYKSDVEKNSWNLENSDKKKHPVAQKAPNAWGFYDMQGNVSEWIWDGISIGNVKERYYMGGNYENWSNFHNESHPPLELA